MNFKITKPTMPKFTKELQTSLINSAVGCGAGYLSSLFTKNTYGFAAGIAALAASTGLIHLALKGLPKTDKGKIDSKYWLSHFLYPFAVFWIFVWIIFYNI